jgi:hypothetical protein
MHCSFDKHLASGDRTNLDYCEVKAITSDYDMTIIALDSFYSVLSCRLAPPDVLSTPCRQCVDNSGACTLPGSCL